MRLDSVCFSWKLFVYLGLMASLTQCATSFDGSEVSTEADIAKSAEDVAPPSLTIQDWPSSTTTTARVSIVTIPPNYPIEIAVSDVLRTVAEFATETNALAVLNGGFFDPNNAQTTSFVTINGALTADPRENQRLVGNPDLAEYMDQILNRSEFRRYHCTDGTRYDITVHQTAVPDDCELHSALGAGPQLLPQDTSRAEGFTDYVNGALIRDAIGSQQRNARSAIGIKQDDSLVWIMAARTDAAGGMTLAELSDFMKMLGVTKALNLDGGSSSSLYFDQQLMPGLEQRGLPTSEPAMGNQPVPLRPVKSVLYLSLPQKLTDS